MTITQRHSNLEAALFYAQIGWKVFPITPGQKFPLAKSHGKDDASNDPAVINDWFSGYPERNVAVAMGPGSGVMAFDIDPKNLGDISWDKWIDENGKVPGGITQISPSGGFHHIAKYDDRFSSDDFIPGVDLQSKDAYLLVYPSKIRVEGGGYKYYEWEGEGDPWDGVIPFVVPDPWVVAYEALKGSPKQRGDSSGFSVIPEGARDKTLTALAGHLQRIGLPENAMRAALDSVNADVCNPPMRSQQVDKIIKSVARYEPDFDFIEAQQRGISSVEALFNKPVHIEQNIIDKLQTVCGSDLSDEYEAPDELVEGLFCIGSLVVVYGDSNSGKTFWALSVATAIATGDRCYGRQTDQGIVIYLASEAPGSIRSRMQAIKKHRGVSLENLYMVPLPLNFFNGDEHTDDVIKLVKEIEEKSGKKVQLIIGDTLARLSSGANENSGEDMGPIMDKFNRISTEIKSAFMLIHHNGKDAAKGGRGWSGIRAFIDTEIEVIEKDGVRSVTVTKQREMPSKGEVIYFKLEVVEMGFSKFGEVSSTCVAMPDDNPVPVKNSITKSLYDDNVRKIEDAWVSSGKEYINDMPYITRSALKMYLETLGMQARTIENMLQKNRKGSLISKLIEVNYIQETQHGWTFIDEKQVSAMEIKSRMKAK
jgi:archaellum biogenesis ATPase FlaH